MFGTWGEKSNLTEKQLLFWLGHLMNPEVELDTDATTYGFQIAGALDPDRFRKVVDQALGESNALKSVFAPDPEGVPQQFFRASLDGSCDLLELNESELEAWVATRVATPIALDRESFSTSLVRLSETRHLWCFKYHHLVGDASSVALLYQRASNLYLNPEAPELQQSPVNFKVFERNRRVSPAYRDSLQYWDSKLEGESSGKAAGLYTTSLRTLELSEVHGRALISFCGLNGLRSPAIGLLTALFGTLFVQNQSCSAIVGMNLRDRPQAFKNTFGLFVSTCPLKIRGNPAGTLFELANLIQSEVGEISKQTQTLVPNPVHNRVWNTLFNYLHLDFSNFAGFPVTVTRHLSRHSNKQLNFQVRAFAGTNQFSIDLLFADAIYPQALQEKFVSDYSRILQSCLDGDPSPLSDLIRNLSAGSPPRLSRREVKPIPLLKASP